MSKYIIETWSQACARVPDLNSYKSVGPSTPDWAGKIVEIVTLVDSKSGYELMQASVSQPGGFGSFFIFKEES